MTDSEGLKEVDNGLLLSTSKSTAKLEGNVDEAALLTSLSSLAETDANDILEKKEHRRAEADSSSSSSSTRSSTQCSDIASQPDEDEEEIFEDASSVLADGTYGSRTDCYTYMCVLTHTHTHTHTHAHAHTLGLYVLDICIYIECQFIYYLTQYIMHTCCKLYGYCGFLH